MENRRFAGSVCAVVLLVAVSCLVGFWGMQQMHRQATESQVREVLANDNLMTRIQETGRLRDARGPEALAAVVQELDDPDSKTRARACSALALFQTTAWQAEVPLAAHLKSSPYPYVRFACAVALMATKTPVVHAAYLQALHDSSEKVVKIACMELPSGGGSEDVEALAALLNHPSWSVRLEACKALIVMKKADTRVVTALEAMRNTPEATRYDAEIDQFDREDKAMGSSAESIPHWGKLDTILQKARNIVAGGVEVRRLGG